MSPAHRRRVGKQLVGHLFADRPEMIDGISDVGRVPLDDRGDDEVQARCAELLRFVRAVGNAALLESADGLREKMPLLGLVQARLTSAA